MSAASEVMLATAKSSTVTQAANLVAQGKTQFMALFGTFIKGEDLLKIEGYYNKALLAKIGQFSAHTTDEAIEYADQYEAAMESVETIGNAYEIVGKAKAGVFVRGFLHALISGFFAVGGAVLQVGLGVALPGVGSFIGAGLNQGLQHVVAYFNKEES